MCLVSRFNLNVIDFRLDHDERKDKRTNKKKKIREKYRNHSTRRCHVKGDLRQLGADEAFSSGGGVRDNTALTEIQFKQTKKQTKG